MPLEMGLLTKYVKNGRGKQEVDNCPLPRTGIINVIIGGITPDGDSNLDRKSYVRTLGVAQFRRRRGFNKNIIFSEKDLISVATPHDDALMIIGDIAYFDVKLVLVV